MNDTIGFYFLNEAIISSRVTYNKQKFNYASALSVIDHTIKPDVQFFILFQMDRLFKTKILLKNGGKSSILF